MSTEIERGRDALLAWEASKPTNYFTWDGNLSRVLELRLGAARFQEERVRLSQAGEAVATRLRHLAVSTNHDANLPRLERFDGLGVRHEQVVFHPSYHDAGRLIWQTGVLSDYSKPGNETLQMALLYLFAQVGESGHLCPLACTAGMIKSIQQLGTEEQKKKYLPGLYERDYDKRIHASQFLTEVQGGSDVGLNAVVARAEDGGYRLYGEKADAAIVGNLYGSAKRVCRSLSARNYAALFARLDRAMASPPALVRRAGAQGDSETTRSPDLARLLPAMRYSRDDVTPYLTSGILLARDPASGAHHVCFVRMSLAGGNKLLVNPATSRIRRIVEETVGRGSALDVAILVGAPAEVTLMACVGVGEGVDKLAVAQAMGGGALACTDDPLPLPVDTEYALTGRIVPSYEREGPVGDQKGLYSVRERNPACLVDAIRVRREPTFHSVSGGVSREHIELVTLGPRAVLERIRAGRDYLPAHKDDSGLWMAAPEGVTPIARK